MKKRRFWKRTGILTAMFIAAMIVSSLLTNQGTADRSVDMASSTLPRIKFLIDTEKELNPLVGYRDEMETAAMRDTITPVQSDQILMVLERHGNDISKIQYTLCSLDGQTTYKKGSVKESNGTVKIPLEGTLPQGEEGVLTVTLTVNGKPLHYYTRVVSADVTGASSCFSFAQKFHEDTFGEDASALTSYLESNEDGDNSTYQTVTIHSDITHVMWGDLKPTVSMEPEWDVKESNNTYTSLLAKYQVTIPDDSDTVATYNVREFFRIRYYRGQLYLLDYQRTMDQVFDPSSRQVLTETGIDLGITDSDIDYRTNASGTVVSFVAGRDLWTYRKDSDELSLVFSFSNTEGNDIRNWYDQHKVRILDMEKSGSTTFAVYGYMNRGDHEGRVGVNIFYFDIDTNALEEKAFIPSTKSFVVAEDELGRMVYYNRSNHLLHVLTGGTLYEIDLQNGEQKKLAEQLQEGQYVTSEDGHLIAYQPSGSLNNADSVIVMDLAAGTSRTVRCDKGDTIRPLGFIENDFIYGLAHTSDTGKTISGKEILPMYSLIIQDKNNKTVKTFQSDGIYVADILIDQNLVTVNRLTKKNSLYIGTSQDYITCNETAEKSNFTLNAYLTEERGRQMRLTCEEGISDQNPKILKPKLTVLKDTMTLSLDDQSTALKYYVYGMGELTDVFDRASYAIQKAESISGVVISSSQTYIWEKGNRDLSYDTEIPAFKAEGVSSLEACRHYMEQFPVEEIDLTGCTVEQILYVINKGYPVIGVLNENQAILLTAYTSGSISYIDPSTGQTGQGSYADIAQLMAASGNTFFGYVK